MADGRRGYRQPIGVPPHSLVSGCAQDLRPVQGVLLAVLLAVLCQEQKEHSGPFQMDLSADK